MSVDLPPESILKNFQDNKSESLMDARLDFRVENSYGKSVEFPYIKPEGNQPNPGTPYLDKFMSRDFARKRSFDTLHHNLGDIPPFSLSSKPMGSIDEPYRNRPDTSMLMNSGNPTMIPPQIEDRINSFFQSDRELRWIEVRKYCEIIRRYADMNDMSQDNFASLYHTVLSLLKTVDSLDPSKQIPFYRRSSIDYYANTPEPRRSIDLGSKYDYLLSHSNHSSTSLPNMNPPHLPHPAALSSSTAPPSLSTLANPASNSGSGAPGNLPPNATLVNPNPTNNNPMTASSSNNEHHSHPSNSSSSSSNNNNINNNNNNNNNLNNSSNNNNSASNPSNYFYPPFSSLLSSTSSNPNVHPNQTAFYASSAAASPAPPSASPNNSGMVAYSPAVPNNLGGYNPNNPGSAASMQGYNPNNMAADEGKKRRRRKPPNLLRNLRCETCGATETPEWRRGPNGDHSLCNACGLHYAKSIRKQRMERENRKHSIDMLLNNNPPNNNNNNNNNMIAVKTESPSMPTPILSPPGSGSAVSTPSAVNDSSTSH